MQATGTGFSRRLVARLGGAQRQRGCQHHRCLSLMDMSLLELSASHVNLNDCTSQGQVVDALQQGDALKSDSLAAAFRQVDRALFIPGEGVGLGARYAEPYGPNPQKLFHGATLSTPQHHATVAELLVDVLVPGAKVLDVGCGTGYLCAIFAKLVGPQGVVVGSDRIPSCVDFGTGVLAQLGLSDTVRLFTSSTTGSEDAERPASNEFALAPFDCIHVGFAIPYAERESILAGLGACLSPGGRMVAAVVDEDGKQHLCLMQHGSETGSGGNEEMCSGMHIKRIMLTACQAMEDGGVLDESAIDSRSHGERLADTKEQLDAWKSKFETNMQRKPTKADMDADPEAKALFQAFVDLRKRIGVTFNCDERLETLPSRQNSMGGYWYDVGDTGNVVVASQFSNTY